VGRYLRVDPIGFASGDFNLFRYCQNNSINYIDFSGKGYQYMRPLDSAALDDITFGPFNHTLFILDDGKTNIGYYGDSQVRSEEMETLKKFKNQYIKIGPHLNDYYLKIALDKLKPFWDIRINPKNEKHKMLLHNCHDFNKAVIKQYNIEISKGYYLGGTM
jgi:hypothetical protein